MHLTISHDDSLGRPRNLVQRKRLVTPRRPVNSCIEVADDVTMLCCPDLMALYQGGAISMEGVKAVQLAMIAHCENMKDRFAILDCPPGLNPQQMKDWRMNETGYDTKYGALYYPWLKVANPLGNGESIAVPPCGYMAGIYARSDTERGVHKAPANEVIRGAMGVEMLIGNSTNPLVEVGLTIASITYGGVLCIFIMGISGRKVTEPVLFAGVIGAVLISLFLFFFTRYFHIFHFLSSCHRRTTFWTFFCITRNS